MYKVQFFSGYEFDFNQAATNYWLNNTVGQL